MPDFVSSPPERQYEREARTLAIEHPWSANEIHDVLVFLGGDVCATRVSLRSAAELNLTPMHVARVNAAMTRQEGDADDD